MAKLARVTLRLGIYGATLPEVCPAIRSKAPAGTPRGGGSRHPFGDHRAEV